MTKQKKYRFNDKENLMFDHAMLMSKKEGMVQLYHAVSDFMQTQIQITNDYLDKLAEIEKIQEQKEFNEQLIKEDKHHG